MSGAQPMSEASALAEASALGSVDVIFEPLEFIAGTKAQRGKPVFNIDITICETDGALCWREIYAG